MRSQFMMHGQEKTLSYSSSRIPGDLNIQNTWLFQRSLVCVFLGLFEAATSDFVTV